MATRATTRGHDLVVVGTIVKPHGIKGELCAICHADSPSLLLAVSSVFLMSKRGAPEPHTVKSMRMHKGRPLLTLKGVSDRNRAEELRGCDIAVRRQDLPDTGDGEVYLHDIIGFTVCLEDGTELGPFTRFMETPATEVWIVDHPKGEIMLPAVDEVVLDIDVDQRRITVSPPEGLLDLYLNPETPGKKKTHHRPRRTHRNSVKKNKA